MDDGIFSPPGGLSLRQQARWWSGHPSELEIAVLTNQLPDDVFNEISQVAHDNDLAHKVVNEKQVKGLTNDERKRLFSLLTDGGEWASPPQGSPSHALEDLAIALVVKDISSSKERAEAIGRYIEEVAGRMTPDAVYRRTERIEKTWKEFSIYSTDVISLVVSHHFGRGEKFTTKQLHWAIKLVSCCIDHKNPEINLPPI